MRLSNIEEGNSPHKKGTAKYKKHMAAMHAEGYKVLPPMDSKYVERDGLEGPFTTLSGKVVYYDPKEGKYYDPDTDMYMSYDEWNAHNSDRSGMSEWVQEPHEGQKWTGQERNFIHDLCKRHDGIQMQWPKPQTGADGIKGPSPLWDEGNIMSNDADLQKLMSWVEQNKHDVESYFRSDFRVYSKDENGEQGQSDGNQILSNINAKIAGESLELSELQTNTLSSRQTLNVQSKGGVEKDNYTSHARDYDSKKGLTTNTVAQQFDGSTSDRFIMPGGSGIQTTTGADGSYKEKKIQMKGPQSWAYDKPKLNASKKVREETEYSDKQIKMAFGILNDPRYRDGNYDGAYATIEKVAKGLARHPSVRNALKRANESVRLTNEEKAELNEIWPYVLGQAATKIPPITYAGAGIAVADLATKAIDWIRSQIKSEGISEDDKEDANDLKGFDAKTEYALKKLQAKYPHSDNLMSALMSELEKAQMQGKSNDAESSMNDNEHDSRIDAVQDKLNSVIAKNDLKENNPIAGEVAANDLHQKATRVIEKAKWQANNKHK